MLERINLLEERYFSSVDLVLGPSIPSIGPGSKPAAFSRSCASRISCLLKTLLIKAVGLAEADAGGDFISVVCPETILSELPKRSPSAVHPDLHREIADLVLAPSIPSIGPGSKPAAFSRFWSSSISSLVRVFAKPVNSGACVSAAGAKLSVSEVATSSLTTVHPASTRNSTDPVFG